MKKIEHRLLLAIIALGSIGGSSLPVGASPSQAQMDAAIKQYKGGHSGAALAQFRAMSAKEPTNPLLHYWMALCAQNLHQMALAKQEYEWVANYSRDPQMKSLGAKGAAGLGGYSRTSGAVTAAADTGTAGGASKAADSKTADAKGADTKTEKKAEAKKEPKVASIIKVCTPTDRQSAVFAPTFDEVKSSPKYKGIAFTECDATQSQNESNINKWNVSGYPSLVYLDSKGNVLQTQSAIGLSGDSITSMIDQLNGSK